jgi:hypothetical protein
LKAFISKVEYQFRERMVDVNSVRSLIFAQSFLVGNALEWYKELRAKTPPDKRFTSWSELKSLLLLHFPDC